MNTIGDFLSQEQNILIAGKVIYELLPKYKKAAQETISEDEKDVYELLTKPENQGVVKLISDNFFRINENHLLIFWNMFTVAMQNRLEASQYFGEWEFKPLKNFKHKFGFCCLCPTNQISALQIVFAQDRPENVRFSIGLKFTLKTPVHLQDDKYKYILRLKREDGFTNASGTYPYKYLRNLPTSSDFIVSMHHNPIKTVNDYIHEYWNYFVNLRPLIIEINDDISKMHA